MSLFFENNLENKVIYYSNNFFNSISKSKKQIKKLKKQLNQDKRIIIFKNVVSKKIIADIVKNRNIILKNKPLFFKTFMGSNDLYIFNKKNKKSYVKGYFKKIELYPWNKKNKKTYKSLNKIIKVKCIMDNLDFHKSRNFYDKRKFVKLQLNHYPFRKGFLNKHIDGIHKKIIVLHIGMSKKTNRNTKGGLIFHYNKKKINVDKYLGLGDIAIFNPIIPHEVTPSNMKNGRWSLLLSSGYFSKLKGTKLQSKQIN